MGAAASLLRSARRGSGLSQRQMARLAGVRQPSIATIESAVHDPGVDRLDRLLGIVGHRLITVPSLSQSAAEVADVVYELLRAGDEVRAFRQLIQLSDALAAAHAGVRVALTLAAPAPTGDRRYDAFIAGLVEHCLVDEALPVPSWVDEPARRVVEPWVVDPYSDEGIEEDTPPSFSSRGVLLSPSELASV